MSLGGLLGHALLGGVQGGATAAQQVAKRREEFDLKKELIDIEDAKARARLEMQNNFQVQRDESQHGYRMGELAQSNKYQTARDAANHNRSVELAGIKHGHDVELAEMGGGLKSGRFKPIDDGVGNVTAVFDSATGQMISNGGAGSGITPEMDAKAEQIANERVDSMAGWLSGDGADFKEYGGIREAAKAQFKQEALQQLQGGQASGSNPLIQAAQSGKLTLNDPDAAPSSEQATPPQVRRSGRAAAEPAQSGPGLLEQVGSYFDFGAGAEAGQAYEQIVEAVGEGAPIDPRLIEVAMPHLKTNPYYLEKAKKLAGM
ncbi:hypothetical protein [Marinobacterium litorale]|uniref:hypothetical protein n=1 Tax=Marinobacterium litorale TaxID=404770 RepID=UPI0004822B21|nr:hypothetical protein [Marinobacterium litorale]